MKGRVNDIRYMQPEHVNILTKKTYKQNLNCNEKHLQVLMRALRDFNLPKIVTDDVPIIMGLIGDLFPALDVPRKRDMDFEALIRKATLDQKLQPEDNFILKV